MEKKGFKYAIFIVNVYKYSLIGIFGIRACNGVDKVFRFSWEC